MPKKGSYSPLLYDARELETADKVVFLVPGALAPIHIFDPAVKWKDFGYSLVYFRLPGLDGLPLDHYLGIDSAARQIAEFANSYPEKPIRLLGYSTGGAIVIEAMKYIQVPDLKVAALSPAVSKGGGISTLFKSGRDIFMSAIKARTLNFKDIWLEYYRTLLYGRHASKNPVIANKIDKIVEQEKGKIIFPTSELSKSHTQDLRGWTASATSHDSDDIAFFIGENDPVFSSKQTVKLANTVGVKEIVEYKNGGHLLFITHPKVFDDILEFFDEQ